MKSCLHRFTAGWVVFGLAVVVSGRPLPRATPESQGVSSDALLEFVNTLDSRIEGMHSVLVVRHGRVIAEGWWAPYGPDRNHILFSLSKSFTSTAVGLAASEGRLSIDDPVGKFFPADFPADAGNNLKSMRIRDILTMTTGHQDEPPTAADTMSARSFFGQSVPHVPGTHFKYNTAATFMQSAIVQKVSGQTTLDYLRPRLLEPLGITQPVWEANFQGISLGGYGLRVRTEDIAKFGQLYLQKGKWEGRQLVPASWVDAATSKQVSNGSNPSNDWHQGYGFQFWRCQHGAYRGDGAFGQYCIVMPQQDCVVAITSGVKDMQSVLNVVWDKFLPSCQPRKLRSNREAEGRLRSRLNHLEVAKATGSTTSTRATSIINRRYKMPPNDEKIEEIAVKSGDGGRTLTLSMARNGKVQEFPAGHQKWIDGRALFQTGRLPVFSSEPVAGTYGWLDDETLSMKVCATETPFHFSYRLRFNGDQLQFESEPNVSFGPPRKIEITGKALD